MARAKSAAKTSPSKPISKPAPKPTSKSVPKPTSKPKSKPAPKRTSTAAAPASERQTQFLADIVANPDDKKARLVYADLLQELGDPRGEYIALACARADLADDDARAGALDEQLAALLKKHKKAWTARCGENKGARYEYRRGFVEKLSLDAKDLLANAAQIFAAEPIEELNIWKIDESPAKLGASRLAPLLALPLQRIRRLSLARCALTEDDFAALAHATTLGSVAILDLTNGGSEEIPAAPLAKATSLPKLRDLILRGCMIGDDILAELARSTTLRMQKLVLARNHLTPEAGNAIADAVWAPGLVDLDVSSNELFGSEGLRALAESTRLTALRTLNLEFTGLADDAEEILRAPFFQQLTSIDVSSTGIDAAALRPVLGDRLVQKQRGF